MANSDTCVFSPGMWGPLLEVSCCHLLTPSAQHGMTGPTVISYRGRIYKFRRPRGREEMVARALEGVLHECVRGSRNAGRGFRPDNGSGTDDFRTNPGHKSFLRFLGKLGCYATRSGTHSIQPSSRRTVTAARRRSHMKHDKLRLLTWAEMSKCMRRWPCLS